MAKRKNTRDFDDVIKNLDLVNKVNELADGLKDNRTNKKEEAEKGLRRFAHETAKKYLVGYNVTNPEHLDPEYHRRNGVSGQVIEEAAKFIQETVNLGVQIATERASNTFYNNLDDIIDNQTPSKTLEKLVQVEEIIKSVDEEGMELIKKYSAYQSLGEFAKQYNENKRIAHEKGEEIIMQAKMVGAAEAQRKKLRDESMEIQNIGAGLAALSVRLGYIKEDTLEKYALDGFREQAKEAKRIYIDASKGKGIEVYVGNSLKKMAKGSREEFGKAIGLLYASYRDKIRKAA